MATVRVGSENFHDFHVHRQLLCDNSPFFKSAITQNWEESKTGIINMPDDDVETFGLYASWLYGVWPFSKLCTKHTESVTTETSKCLAWETEKWLLGKAYTLGDKILDRDFCDFVTDSMLVHVKVTGAAPGEWYFKIFECSSANAPVRDILTDLYAYAATNNWFKDDTAIYSREAWKAIAQAILNGRTESLCPEQAPWHTGLTCKYHWHAKDGTPCYKTKKSWLGVAKVG
jgi:hypothetical protein